MWRISITKNKLICAVGSRMGTEDTKLLVFDFDWPNKQQLSLAIRPPTPPPPKPSSSSSQESQHSS